MECGAQRVNMQWWGVWGGVCGGGVYWYGATLYPDASGPKSNKSNIKHASNSSCSCSLSLSHHSTLPIVPSNITITSLVSIQHTHTHTALPHSLPSYFATPPRSPNTRIPIAPCLNWCLVLPDHTTQQPHSNTMRTRVAQPGCPYSCIAEGESSGGCTGDSAVRTSNSSATRDWAAVIDQQCSTQSTGGEMAAHTRASAHHAVCH